MKKVGVSGMADDFAKKTAEDFRRIGGQPLAPTPAESAGQKAAGGSADADASISRSVIEAAIERAVRRVLSEHAAERAAAPPGDAVTQAGIDRIAARLAEHESEIAFEIRNVLPGLVRQEIRDGQATLDGRIAALEEALGRQRRTAGWLQALLAGLAFALAAGVILAGLIIFERPLRHWGQDTLFPLFGIGIGEAPRVQPTERRAPPLGQRQAP